MVSRGRLRGGGLKRVRYLGGLRTLVVGGEEIRRVEMRAFFDCGLCSGFPLKVAADVLFSSFFSSLFLVEKMKLATTASRIKLESVIRTY